MTGDGGRGQSRRSADSKASLEGIFARLQESSMSIVDRWGSSDDHVKNTYKDSVWSKEESLGTSLRREVPKKDPLAGGVKLLI